MTSLIYDPVNPERLWKLTDPFGRTAVLGYDAQGRFNTCTDPAGTLSQVSYGADGKVAALTTPYGTSTFTRGTTPAGQWLEMRDARNALERLETRFEQPQPQLVPSGNGQNIQFLAPQTIRNPSTLSHWAAVDPASRALSPAQAWMDAGLTAGPALVQLGPWNGSWSRQLHSADSFGARGQTTYFWDKKATGDNQMADANARQFGWAFGPQGVPGFPAWTKAPLEAAVSYLYQGETAPGVAGNARLIESYRSLDGSQKLQRQRAEYDHPLGLPTKSIDPLGRTKSVSYDPADPSNLLEVRNATLENGNQHNELLASYSNYLNHQPQTITDAAGKQTSILYNARGQTETVTNAKGEVTKYVYDEVPAHPQFGRLLTVTRALGTALAATTTTGYDASGRVSTITDRENYTVTLAYDAIGGDPLQSLDRMTRVTFPDGSYSESRYDDARWPLDVAHARDRLGRETAFEYDSLRNQVKVTDPQGRVTQFVQCPCGAMDKIIDARGNETEWTRDLQKRITGKKIAGQTVATYTYEPDTGRLRTMTDALGQVTTYGYFPDDRLNTVSYTNAVHPTANVAFAYDPAFPRLATLTDGTGLTNYGYVPFNPADAVYGDGQLASLDGPLANDTLTYTYDELGRGVGRSINGAANESSVAFDALGRVNTLTNPLGTFGPVYVNQTGRLDHVTWPNGQRTNYAWQPNAQDQRLASITHLDPAAQTESQHTYGYDTEGKILTWQNTRPGSDAKFTFGYNASDELEEAVQRAEPAQTLLHQSSYAYDKSGNRAAVTEDGKFTSYPANAKNQLTTASGSGSILFRGSVNEPATITLAGQPVTMQGFNWSAWAEVAPGPNSLTLQATETNVAPGFNAQTTTRHIELTLTADAARTFAYDANGSMTDNGATQTYEWDAANRLVAINYTGTNLRTEFNYDGWSRWVKIVEKDGATVTSEKRFVWEGYSLAEERDASNAVTRRYFAQGEQRGALNLYYARDHLGNVRELTDGTGTLRASYEYALWGKRTKLAGDLDCDLGFTGHYQHGPSGFVVAPLRFYTAEFGRWLSRDPIEESGGINLYSYAANNPGKNTDPLGLRPIDISVMSSNMSIWDKLYEGNYSGTYPTFFDSPKALADQVLSKVGPNDTIRILDIHAHGSEAGNFITLGGPGQGWFSGPKGVSDPYDALSALQRLKPRMDKNGAVVLRQCRVAVTQHGVHSMLLMAKTLGVPVIATRGDYEDGFVDGTVIAFPNGKVADFTRGSFDPENWLSKKK